MTLRTKYYASFIVSVVCICGAAIGVAVLEGAVLTNQRHLVIAASILLFTSVIVGIAASFGYYYFGGRQNDNPQIADAGMQVLAAVGKPKEKPPARPKSSIK